VVARLGREPADVDSDQQCDQPEIGVMAERSEPLAFGPGVVVLGPPLHRIDEVEHLVVVAHPTGEFALVVPRGFLGITPNGIRESDRGVEEAAGNVRSRSTCSPA